MDELQASSLRSVYLGVDVGTGSARAACFHAKVVKEEVTGLGFAATCSLVAVDAEGSPVTVSLSGDSRRNIIVRMDRRAEKQAKKIYSCNSRVLQYCNKSLSSEMQPPKLLWLKENLQESWSMACRWMDLSDWLSYRATGDDTRSLSTTVCKWTYLGHVHMQQASEKESRDMEAFGWNDDFWEEIGLGDLVDGHHAKIGRRVAFPGHPLGSGLTEAAAQELALVAGTPVGTSLIDAHASGVGVMESVNVLDSEPKDSDAICRSMVLVYGLSTCYMAVSKNKLFIPGAGGPYWSGMAPGYWLTEGGQSTTGGLLDYIIKNHSASPYLANQAAFLNTSVFKLMNKILESVMREFKVPFLAALTQYTHVLPDMNGIRSLVAGPRVIRVISSLTLNTSHNHLALLYLASVHGIAYCTRHVVEHYNAQGHKIGTLLACGDLAKNPMFIQQHADITGCQIILPRESESVLLGAAILGAVAAKKYSTLNAAMKALDAAGQVIYPSKDPRVKKYHDAKYRIFHALYEQHLSHFSIMAPTLA